MPSYAAGIAILFHVFSHVVFISELVKLPEHVAIWTYQGNQDEDHGEIGSTTSKNTAWRLVCRTLLVEAD